MAFTFGGNSLDVVQDRGVPSNGETITFYKHNADAVAGTNSQGTAVTNSSGVFSFSHPWRSRLFAKRANGAIFPVHAAEAETDVSGIRDQGTLNPDELPAPCKRLGVISTPAAAAGANNGGSPPAQTLVAGSTDTYGGVKFGSGSAPAAGAQSVVTFGTAFTAAPVVVLTPLNTATQALGVYVSSIGTSSFTISTTGAPAASQGGTVYQCNYVVLGG